ncbi:MAG: sigma-70 family RNA polymerase sigma factor [Planctomycetota bacterium]|nr:sigma-70 family RNA polymerase sigma factor [Planctomycetota bacterium]
MSETFIQLIDKLQQGDPAAANRLLEVYGPAIRRIARVRLNETMLRRVEESMDVYQSVMANFLMRASSGQFDLETPGQLIALISTMIRNRVVDKVRFYRTQKRDVQRNVHLADALPPVGRGETASVMIGRDELIRRFHGLLNEEDRLLLHQRAQGRTWQELADQLGATPDQLRKRLARATILISNEIDPAG